MTDAPPAAWRRTPALIVAGAMFMENLDGTIVVTAAPRIAHSLQVTPPDVNLVITAYLIAVATAIPVGGWLAARVGSRPVFCASLVVFALASLCCALSTSLTELTIFRVLQGLGGAMMVPVGRFIVLRSTSKADVIRAVAYITWPALLAPVIAPVVGGIIATYFGWQWIFLINIPIGAAVVILALIFIDRVASEARTLDWPGAVLSTLTLFLLVTGLESLAQSQNGWLTVSALVGGCLVGAGAIAWLLRSAHPLLDLRVLRVKTFRISNSSGFLYRLTIAAAPFILALLFQTVFGHSAIVSGVLIMAIFIGNIGIKPATTLMLHRFGFKSVLITAASMAVVCFVLFSFFDRSTPLPVVFAILLVSGVFRSIGFTAYNTIQFADVHGEELSSANTLSSTIGELATGLGAAVVAVCLRLFAFTDIGMQLLPAYRWTLLVMAGICVVALLGVVRLPAGSADHLRRRPD